MERNIEGYHGPVRGKGIRRPRMQNSRKQFSRGVWRPAIPSWEKEFCYEIGLFTWEDFLEAKKKTIGSEKVMDWDDSGAKEAFHNAKNMFYANKFNIPSDAAAVINYSPDLYIDEVNWDDDGENIPELVHDRELEDARVESEDECVQEEKDGQCNIPVEEDVGIIKATGWGDDDDGGGVEVYFSSGKVLSGLIIGC